MTKIAASILLLVFTACSSDASDPIDTDGDGRRTVAEVCAAICSCDTDATACASWCSSIYGSLTVDPEALAECVISVRDAGMCVQEQGGGEGTINSCSIIVDE